jgi:hypothetical protein
MTEKKFDHDYFERRLLDPAEAAKLPPADAPNVGRVDLVRVPTSTELRAFADPSAKTCGSCQHFNVELGQREMRRSKFLATLTHDWGWNKQHLSADPRDLGVCMKRDGTLVGPHTKYCEFYKVTHR